MSTCLQINSKSCNSVIAGKMLTLLIMVNIIKTGNPKIESIFNKLSENIYCIRFSIDIKLHTIQL